MHQRKKKYHVYITQETYRGMLLEAGRHPGNESIIQMPGLRIGDDFYFDMVADSGIHATYTPTMCEKDHEYADHLATRISEYYDFSKGQMIAVQVHRHPNGCLRFSPGDFPANIKLARQFHGVVNGLMFIDPEFRIRFWYIDENGDETDADYEINDEAVREAMPRIDIKKLKATVERNERVRAALKKADFGTAEKREDCRPAEKRERKSVRLLSLSRILRKGKNMDRTFVDYTAQEGASENVFADFEMLQEALRPYTVLIPEEYRVQQYEGELKGYYHPETKIYNVIPEKLCISRRDARVLGFSVRKDHADKAGQPGLSIVWNDGEAEISIGDHEGAEIHIDYYSCQEDVFSRIEGIVETRRMAKKQAIISGTGSGGFKVGLELVRAGIGSIIAADNDVLGYHNVCRHECGIHDVGRFKVDCFKEKAADINPDCIVYTFTDLIQHVDPAELEKIIWEDSIILSCADNRHAAYVCNELADKYHIPMIDAGCGPRASTGEVFYYKPDSGMACYTCAYGEDKGVDYSNQEVRSHFYATETELEKLHFQPGMYLDIQLTAIFEAKLAIDLLMENEEGYVPKLLPYINQCTVMLNYPVDQDVNPYMHLFGTEDKRKPLTWKTGPAQKNKACSYCGAKDTSENVKCSIVA